MATPQQNLARFQEISNRGLQDNLPDNIRVRFDEAITRGLVTAKVQEVQAPAPQKKSRQDLRRQDIQRRSDNQEDVFAGLPDDIRNKILDDNSFTNRRGKKQTAPQSKLKKVADLERLRLKNPFLAEQIENTGTVDAAKIGFIEGGLTVGRGLGIADQPDDVVKQATEGLKTQRPGAFGAGEVLAESLPFVAASPLAGAGLIAKVGSKPLIAAAKTLGGRVAGGSALTATEGAVIARGKGKKGLDVVKAGIVGGALGFVGEIAGPLLSRASRAKVGGTDVEQISPDGKPSAELEKTLSDEGVSFEEFAQETLKDLTEIERRDAFEKLKLKPTKAQTTRDPDLFGDQTSALSTSGKVRDAVIRQEKILSDTVEGNVKATQGKPARVFESSFNAITDKSIHLDNEIDQLYKEARAAAPDAKIVRFTNAGEALRRNVHSEDLSKGVVKALKGPMVDIGVLSKKFKPTGRVSIDQSERLRQMANTLWDSTTPVGRRILREFKEAVDKDALGAAGKDFFERSREAKKNFEVGLSADSRSKFDKRKTSLVRDIQEGKISEDVIADRIVNRGATYGPKELKEYRSYLLSGTKEQIAQGAQAWNDVRAYAFDKIRKSSFTGSETELGTQSLSRSGLNAAIDKIGDRKMNVLFNSEELSFIKDLHLVAALKESPPGVRSSIDGATIRRLQRAFTRVRWLGGEVVNEAIDLTRTRATQARLLKVADKAERIQLKRDNELNKRLLKARGSKTGEASKRASVVAAASASSDREE